MSSFAVPLTAVLVALLAGSVYVGTGAWQRVEQGRLSEAAAQKKVADAQALWKAVEVSIPHVDTATARGDDIDTAMARTVSQVLSMRQAFRFQIDSIGSERTVRGADTRPPLRDMAQPVAYTQGKLVEVTLRVRGAYRDYDLFKQFAEQLRGLPAALVEMKVTGRSFEMKLRVIGTPASTVSTPSVMEQRVRLPDASTTEGVVAASAR